MSQTERRLNRVTALTVVGFAIVIAAAFAEAIIFGTAASFFVGGFCVLLVGIYLHNTYYRYFFSKDRAEEDCDDFVLDRSSRGRAVVFAVVDVFIVTASAVVEAALSSDYRVTILIMIVLLVHFYYLTFKW